MATMKKKYAANTSCPISTVQTLMSGKWKMMIIYLLSQKTRRFNELQRLLNNSISQTILTNQLRELENDGLVYREIYKEIPPRVEYSLTDLGRTFLPVLKNMSDWGRFYKEALKETDIVREE